MTYVTLFRYRLVRWWHRKRGHQITHRINKQPYVTWVRSVETWTCSCGERYVYFSG